MNAQAYFPVSYPEIMKKLSAIDPPGYARSRNFIDGAVTGLSPYLSRGVFSPRQVMEYIFSAGYTLDNAGKLIQELAWREYWQRCWWHLGERIGDDIKRPQDNVRHRQMVTSIVEARTGIEAIDGAIDRLYQTGYMHNHARMYLAALACNMAGAHWKSPANWLYYHLLDGDPASNFLSWQWVAGTFSSKKYYANQDNINYYFHSRQKNTFADLRYDLLPQCPVPSQLEQKMPFQPRTVLPPCSAGFLLDPDLPVLLYNSFQLDPCWRSDMHANRVLLLEPSHFEQYPVSNKVISFICALAQTNIPGLLIFSGEVNQLPGLNHVPAIYSVEHPTTKHYPGKKDPYLWIFPEINSYSPSFSGFWKKAERLLIQKSK